LEIVFLKELFSLKYVALMLTIRLSYTENEEFEQNNKTMEILFWTERFY